MFELTSRASYDSVPTWYDRLMRVCGRNIPIVLIGTKTEAREVEMLPHEVVFHLHKNIQYFEISSKTGYNLKQPLLRLLRKLSGCPHLEFSGADADSAADVTEEVEVEAGSLPPAEEDSEDSRRILLRNIHAAQFRPNT